jgi:ABC-type phosphate/phosphonate transport system substrate-binding protein/tRNA A-37 threonylcarbamoyl transferase component Bud32
MKPIVVSTASNMGPVRTCRNCGVTVGKDAPFGHCPRCLLELGFVNALAPEGPRKSPAGRLQFGDYDLIEQIGRGGMGVVYKARQVSLNRTVALKMVLDSHLASPVVLRRFLIEAEAAAKLDHPNIVPIYEIAEIEGQHFFSMRLIEGESLERKVALGEWDVPKRGKTRFGSRDKTQEKIATLIATVARAVHYAHERGVLHRDLKPSNILIDKQGQPHLTDFGLAKIADNTVALTPATTVLGTPGYMAPEQAMGAVSQAAGDVYSLGAILYDLLTGKPPFDAATAMEILRRTREEEPINPRRKNDAIDEDLVTICLKCLEKDAAQRYVSAEALGEDLERWLRREPIHARPVRITGRMRRWCYREPMLALMTFGLIGLITLFALMTNRQYRREKANRMEFELRSAVHLRTLMKRIQDDRERGDKALRISAQEVPVLLREPIPLDGAEKSMILSAITPERNPDRMIQPLGYLLADLQNKLRAQAGIRVAFDLRLYNRAQDLMEGLGDGAEVAWVDAAIYVQGRQRLQYLQPVARETYRGGSTLLGAIVTRTNSGITNLAGLRGHLFAFGDKDSAIGWYLPKAMLVRAGIRARDLQTTNVPVARVLSMVRSGDYDAGAVLEADLQKLRQAGGDLRVLDELRCPGHPWVFIKEVEKPMFEAFRGAFLSLGDQTVLGRLGNNVRGFIPTDAAEYDQLEADIKLAEQFDVP